MTEKTIHLDKKEFELIKSGKKNFEVRLGNKDINEGDTLIIIEKDNQGNATNNKLTKKAGHIVLTKNLTYFNDEYKNKFGFKIIQLD